MIVDDDLRPTWTEWKESDCSVTCGVGITIRTRVCRGGTLEDCQAISDDNEHVVVSECTRPACLRKLAGTLLYKLLINILQYNKKYDNILTK